MLEIYNSPLTENRQIIYSAVKCLVCDKVIESQSVHDYKKCGCENETMIDGGLDYVRYGGKDMNKIELITHYYNEPYEIVREFAFRSGYGKDGRGPFTVTRIKDMSDNYVKAAMEYLVDRNLSRKDWVLDILYKELEYRIMHNIKIEEK